MTCCINAGRSAKLGAGGQSTYGFLVFITQTAFAERDHDDWRYPRQLRWERLVTGPDVDVLLAPSYDRPLLPATTVSSLQANHTRGAWVATAGAHALCRQRPPMRTHKHSKCHKHHI